MRRASKGLKVASSTSQLTATASDVERSDNILQAGVMPSFATEEGMEKTQIVLINGKPHYFKGEPGTLTYDEISNLAGINPETKPIIHSDATSLRRAFTITEPDDIAPRENGAIYRVVPRPKWVMHVIGPDEVHNMPDELTALREANKLNKNILKWRNEDPSPHEPFMVALVKDLDVEGA